MPKKHPKTIPKSRRLKLAHLSYTGKRLHRTHTSYPLLAALLLMVGVFLSVMTIQVRAEDVVVNGVVNGDPPTIPAVILSPEQDNRFTNPTVPVSGTCDPYFFIKIFRNNIFAGAGECSPDGEFTVTIELFPGRNDLVARSFSVSENEGPPSNTVSVYYDAPVTTDSGPFYLTTEYFLRAGYSGQPIIWDLEIHGGTGPFTVNVDWGDGNSDTIKDLTSRTFRLNHDYNLPQGSREHYTVTVIVYDANGQRTSLQLIAIMNDPAIIAATFAEPSNPGTNLGLLWLAFVIVVLMGICFWLGERRGESVTNAFYRKRRVA
jgi:hypothetical protein